MPLINLERKRDKQKKPTRFHLFVWWQVEPEELNKQVSEYDTLRFYQSVRGIALLMLLFSAGISILLGYLQAHNVWLEFPDVLIFVIIGVFIFLGFKWANMIGMIFWTFEKGYQIYVEITTGQAGLLISILIWWTAFMQVFYLSFLVEKRRKQAKALLLSEPPSQGTPPEAI